LNPSRTPPARLQPGPAPRSLALSLVGWAAGFACLALLAWSATTSALAALPPAVFLAAQTALAAGTAIFFEIGLARLTGLRRPASSRPAALAAAAAGTAVVLLASPGAWPDAVLVAIFGGALGGLASAWRVGGLWEDNYPPSPEVQAAVAEAHRRRPGFGLRLPIGKRAFDLELAALGLVVALPLTLLLAILIWLEDPGPLFFVKNAVGLGGRNFRQWKLRTMVFGAEGRTGPVRAQDDDARALRVGALLRKTALDELPQIWNILVGDMSFVGPRPQRTVLVADYLQVIPEYADRHCVRPGLAGLAQVAGSYHISPRQKLRFDRLYVSHASLGFDLWLIALACLVVFWWRWQPDWRGQLPPDRLRNSLCGGRRRR
jgi:lipopolysaccharide/colanic/teichoic acid biosynthesis glycosyltransferase